MQDAIREATVEFILKRPENLELALQVQKAMGFVPRELCRRVLEGVQGALEEWKQNDNALDDWDIFSSYQDDKKDLMEGLSYLALRRNSWERETGDKNYTSGAQLVTDEKNWGAVYLGICFPKNYGNKETERAFKDTLHHIGNLESEGVWRRYHFYNWNKEGFWITAIREMDSIAKELADGLVHLARLVDDTGGAQAHPDGD